LGSSQNVILSEAKDLETAEILRFAQNDTPFLEMIPFLFNRRIPRPSPIVVHPSRF